MTQKVKSTDDSDSSAKMFGWFVLSWWVAFIAGTAVCLFLMWFAIFMVADDFGVGLTSHETARSMILYGLLACMVIAAAIYAVRKLNHPFFHYGKIALWIGFGFNALFVIGGIAAGLITTLQLASTTPVSSISCENSRLVDSNLWAATVPIATEAGTGTAFAVDDKGHYVTAYHVIEGAKSVYINTVDGESNLKVVKTAPEFDLALLKGVPNEFPLTLTWDYDVSDSVYALGYPANTFTAGQATLSRGVISRILENDDLLLTSDEIPKGLKLLQTDAATNPGNSGGPLVNGCGRVVGVIVAGSNLSGVSDLGLESEQSINYAVSAETMAVQLDLKLETSAAE